MVVDGEKERARVRQVISDLRRITLTLALVPTSCYSPTAADGLPLALGATHQPQTCYRRSPVKNASAVAGCSVSLRTSQTRMTHSGTYITPLTTPQHPAYTRSTYPLSTAQSHHPIIPWVIGPEELPSKGPIDVMRVAVVTGSRIQREAHVV